MKQGRSIWRFTTRDLPHYAFFIACRVIDFGSGTKVLIEYKCNIAPELCGISDHKIKRWVKASQVRML
jgi:hypothetical protein